MKKFLVTALGLLCATTLVVSAQDATPATPAAPAAPEAAAPAPEKPAKHAKHAKHELTAEQKALRKEMMEKYDTNKNGKLSKEERSKMTKEDKEKWAKTFGHHKKAKAK